MGKKLSQRRESSTQRGRESPLRGAGSAAAGWARRREVRGRGRCGGVGCGSLPPAPPRAPAPAFPCATLSPSPSLL